MQTTGELPERQDSGKTIAVVGLGYVGLPLALLADRKGYAVIGIDIDRHRIENLQKRIAPMKDAAIARALKQTRMEFTDDFESIRHTSIVIICVPTPVYENRTPNLEPVRGACERIAPYLTQGHLVVLESTVNPGISESVVAPILSAVSGLSAGEGFYLAHCPERINPGDKRWNVENIPRVVGSLEPKGLAKAIRFYRSILKADIKPMGTLKEAEAVKIVENSFRDINIAFVNELARSFHHLGIDIENVIEGAATKPFAFMPHHPGAGVGGHCIPVDPYYLIQYAKRNGFEHRFLSLARRINNEMPKFVVDLVREGFSEQSIAMRGSKVAVLGLAYKADIDDVRESPSFKIIEYLEQQGADVVSYDPHCASESTASSLEEAMAGASAIVIATAHREFRALTPQALAQTGVKVIVDGRNCLSGEKFSAAGITYKGIGRSIPARKKQVEHMTPANASAEGKRSVFKAAEAAHITITRT